MITLSRSLRHRRAALALSVAAVLLGCPPDDKKSPAPTPSGRCERVGQSCEYSPGKLGTCVVKDDCTGADCYTCQSQH